MAQKVTNYTFFKAQVGKPTAISFIAFRRLLADLRLFYTVCLLKKLRHCVKKKIQFNF